MGERWFMGEENQPTFSAPVPGCTATHESWLSQPCLSPPGPGQGGIQLS